MEWIFLLIPLLILIFAVFHTCISMEGEAKREWFEDDPDDYRDYYGKDYKGEDF